MRRNLQLIGLFLICSGALLLLMRGRTSVEPEPAGPEWEMIDP